MGLFIMKVLSLFDGMSCGRQALADLNIKVDVYDASEIDKDAIRVSKENHSDINHIGDVSKLSFKEGDYDLLMAGSPCQGFSFLGTQTNFEHSKSKLYFQFLRILNEVKPKFFLLENVMMKSDFEKVITSDLNTPPVVINSLDYLPQNRRRNYWTNLELDLNPMKDKFSIKDLINYTKEPIDYIWSDRYTFTPIHDHKSRFGIRGVGGLNKQSSKRWGDGDRLSSFSQGYRVYSPSGVSPCLCTIVGGFGGYSNLYCGDLQNPEASLFRLPRGVIESLQGLPIGYTKSVSVNKAAFMLGNGWTVDVIKDIIKKSLAGK